MKTKSMVVLAALVAIATGSLQKATAQNTAPFWSLAGNSGTNPPAQFLGTTDNKGLLFKTQGISRMWIGQGGNVGIGTNAPKANLHIFRGSSGTVTPNANSPLIIENSTNNYISLLTPSANEKGIIFGDNANPVNGAILYNSSENMLFQTGKKVTRMVLTAAGNLGIGQTAPAAKLQIVGGSDVNANSGGYIIVGDLSSSNLGIDNNEIQARTGSGAGNLNLNNSGGDISMRAGAMYIVGASGNVGIGTTTPTNKLQVNGSVGIGSIEQLYDAGSDLLGCSASFVPNTDGVDNSLGTSSLRWTSLWATDGTINTSDARDKKNIRDLDYGLKQIMQLHAVKFKWKNEADAKEKIGVIAQEIQKVLPEVVRDYEFKVNEATGKSEKVPAARLGVMYADIIPVLIKSIQELEMQVLDLKKQISSSGQTTVNSSSESSALTPKIINSGAALEQNAPNPFSSTTTIRYRVPAAAANVQIMVTNTAGSTVKSFTLTGKGAGAVTINAGELTAGSYHYTLIVDGKKMDSKQMVLVK